MSRRNRNQAETPAQTPAEIEIQTLSAADANVAAALQQAANTEAAPDAGSSEQDESPSIPQAVEAPTEALLPPVVAVHHEAPAVSATDRGEKLLDEVLNSGEFEDIDSADIGDIEPEPASAVGKDHRSPTPTRRKDIDECKNCGYRMAAGQFTACGACGQPVR